MSSSSPDDLAVAFRSFHRRLLEATDGIETGDHELDDLFAKAAGLVHCDPSPQVIADAIEAIPADAWAGTTLDDLRAIATDAGRRIRSIADAGD